MWHRFYFATGHDYGVSQGHSAVPAVSPRTQFVDDFFATDAPDAQAGIDYWYGAPPVTQPTQQGESVQPEDATPQQPARHRHPPDNLTYPTAQIRQRKKGGPSKRARGGHS